MSDAFAGPAREGFTCPTCGRFVTTAVQGLFSDRKRGSPRRFCTPGCRQAAYRRRLAGVPETIGLQHRGGKNRRLKGGG